MTVDKDTLGKDLVKSFHTQFAQNQNHHQMLFLQILVILLTVLTGFGYLFVHLGANSAGIVVSQKIIYAALVMASYVLSLGIALIANMAHGFRRDQAVACKIRHLAGVMSTDDRESFFPKSYNPSKHKFKTVTAWLEWMPGFHQIFFVALLLIKLMLVGMVLSRPACALEFALPPDYRLTLAVVLIIASFCVDGFSYWWFGRKRFK